MSACRTLLCATIWVVCLLSTGVDAATPAISAGGYHTIGLKIDGTVRAWGLDGSVLACGDNSFRQLGNGTTTTRSSPQQGQRARCRAGAAATCGRQPLV